MLFRRRLADDELSALIDNACAEVTERTARRRTSTDVVDELVDRRLATHTAIASVLAEALSATDRSALLEPLRVVLRREAAWLLTSEPGRVEVEVGARLLRDVDDVLAPEAIDCLMVAADHDVTVAKPVLSEALATIVARSVNQSGSGPHRRDQLHCGDAHDDSIVDPSHDRYNPSLGCDADTPTVMRH